MAQLPTRTIDISRVLPAYMTGAIDLARYPGVQTGALGQDAAAQAQRLQNARQLATALATGKYIELAPERFEYTATESQAGRPVGLQVPSQCPGLVGAGSSGTGTRLVQYARDCPVLTIGDIGSDPARTTAAATFGGFVLGYGSSQAGAPNASTLMLGRAWMSRFYDIREDSSLAGAGSHNPGMIGLHLFSTDHQFFFSNALTNIRIYGAQQNLLRVSSLGTGNTWTNVYFGGGTFGQRVRLSGAALHLSDGGRGFALGHVAQLNVEWVEAEQILFMEGVRTGAVDSLRFEGCKLAGARPRLIQAVNTLLSIRSLAVVDNWVPLEARQGATMISADHGGALDIVDAEFQWSGEGYHPEATIASASRLVEVAPGSASNLSLRNVSIDPRSQARARLAIDSSIPVSECGAIARIGTYEFRATGSATRDSQIIVGDADQTVYGAHGNPTIRFSEPLTRDRFIRISPFHAPAAAGKSRRRLAADVIHIRRDPTATGAAAVIVVDARNAVAGRLAQAGEELIVSIDADGLIRAA